MKKNISFLLILAATVGSISSKSRHIARGAVEGELYMAENWYCNCGFFGDTLYKAIHHITENEKKLEITHSMQYRPSDAGIADSLHMQAYNVIADATPCVVYNIDWFMDSQFYDNIRLWFSDDYGKNWVLRDVPDYQSLYYVSKFEGLIYRGGAKVAILLIHGIYCMNRGIFSSVKHILKNVNLSVL
jgi:dTDP-glucose pyrophosphorylase